MREYLGNNDLIKAEHSEYGTWYFTTIGQCSTALCEENSRVTYHMRKNKELKDWKLSIEEDCGDVQFKYINPTLEEIENNKK